MMYEELIKNLRKMQNHEYCVLVSIDGFPAMQFVKQAADAIEDLSKTLDEEVEINTALECNMPVWIPVTERLPEDYDPVLTCDERGNIHIFRHLRHFEYPFGIKPENTRYYMPKWWMPLPQPPESEEQNGNAE